MEYLGFFEKRNDLIAQLEKKEITKTKYIEENFRLFVDGKEDPDEIRISTIDEGIVLYHYFNTKAKYLFIMGQELYYRDTYRAKAIHDEALDYYSKKDKITLLILEKMEYKEMDAYYVEAESEELSDSLYEIVLVNYTNVIFHSKDKLILNRLMKNGVFKNQKLKSKIHDYINTKY